MISRERFKRRRNFLPTLLLAILFWIGWGYLVYFVSPERNFILLTFYSLLFTSVFLTFSLIFANSRRGLLMAAAVVCFLLLRYYQLGNPFNIFLLVAILIGVELYYR